MANILLTGATGNVGSAAAHYLKASGTPFKVMVRSEEKAKKFQDQGIPAVIADFTHPATLDKALEHVDRALLVAPPHEKMTEFECDFIDSAEENDVEYIVKISAVGASAEQGTHLGVYHAKTEDYLKKTSMNYTIIRPHSFMQNLFGSLSTIREQGAIYAAMGEGRFPLVDARDIGEVAGRLLQDPGGYHARVLNITGPEALSYHDIAGIVGAAAGKTVNYIDIPPETMVEALTGMGFPNWLASDLATLNRIWSDGKDITVDHTAEKILGRKPRSFRQFVADHQALFGH